MSAFRAKLSFVQMFHAIPKFRVQHETWLHYPSSNHHPPTHFQKSWGSSLSFLFGMVQPTQSHLKIHSQGSVNRRLQVPSSTAAGGLVDLKGAQVWWYYQTLSASLTSSTPHNGRSVTSYGPGIWNSQQEPVYCTHYPLIVVAMLCRLKCKNINKCTLFLYVGAFIKCFQNVDIAFKWCAISMLQFA